MKGKPNSPSFSFFKSSVSPKLSFVWASRYSRQNSLKVLGYFLKPSCLFLLTSD